MASKFSSLQTSIFLIIIASAAATASAIEEPISLDVEALTSSTYLTMLEKIRRGLAETYSGHVAVLPVTVQTNNPPLLDVVLKTARHQITLKVRETDVYVWGYKMQTPPLWLERGSNESAPHLIDNSEFLGFGENYASVEAAAQTNRLSVSLTKADLIKAVDELATTTVKQVRAEHMIRLIQMVAEATRFADVSNLLASNLDSESSKLEPYMANVLLKNWPQYSTMVLRAEADPCYEYVPPVVQGGEGDTVEQLRNRLGLMYRDPITLCPPCEPIPCTDLTSALNDSMPTIEMVAQA